MNKYHRKIVSMFLIVGGASLMIEHLFTWDRFDLLDFWGHEYLGVGFIIIALIISTDFKQWKELDIKRLSDLKKLIR